MTSKLRKTILVVDDYDVFREMLSRHLLLKGYYVFQADTGKKALDAIYRFDIDLVVVDVHLPGFSGIKLFQRMRAINSELLVVVITGDVNLDNVVNCLNFGVDGLLIKPFKFDEFFEMVSRLFSKKLKAEELLKLRLRRARRKNQDELKLMNRLYDE